MADIDVAEKRLHPLHSLTGAEVDAPPDRIVALDADPNRRQLGIADLQRCLDVSIRVDGVRIHEQRREIHQLRVLLVREGEVVRVDLLLVEHVVADLFPGKLRRPGATTDSTATSTGRDLRAAGAANGIGVRVIALRFATRDDEECGTEGKFRQNSDSAHNEASVSQNAARTRSQSFGDDAQAHWLD